MFLPAVAETNARLDAVLHLLAVASITQWATAQTIIVDGVTVGGFLKDRLWVRYHVPHFERNEGKVAPAVSYVS